MGAGAGAGEVADEDVLVAEGLEDCGGGGAVGGRRGEEEIGLGRVGKIPWRRKWQPTLVFLPGESHGQRNLVGYGP